MFRKVLVLYRNALRALEVPVFHLVEEGGSRPADYFSSEHKIGGDFAEFVEKRSAFIGTVQSSFWPIA